MMNKKILILLLLFGMFFVPVKGLALDLERSYEKTYTDNDYRKTTPVLLPSYDNTGKSDGYIIYSDYGITKYSNDNEMVFTKGINEVNKDSKLLSVNQISAGSEDSVKGMSDIKIVLTNEAGEVAFQKLYGGTGYEDDYDFIPSYNADEKLDGYVIFLVSSSLDLENITPGNVMIKYDLKGNLVWQKNCNMNFNVGRPVFFEKNDNVYALFYNSDDANELALVNFSDYSVIFNKDLDFYIDQKILSYTSTSEVDGFIFVNSKSIIKYDLEGNVVFNINTENYISKIIPSRNVDGKYDGFIVVDEYTGVIYKYDSNGKVVWQDANGNHGGVFYNGIIESFDDTGRFNGYILSGTFADHVCREVEKSSFASVSGKVKRLEYGYCSHGLTVIRYTYPFYDIVKDNTDEGEITVGDNAYPGEVVKIKVTPKEGYVLKRIVVLDESGKEIEVSDDGTFIMPEGKVTVTAIYSRITNPETVSVCYVVLGIILLISIGTLVVQKKKENV